MKVFGLALLFGLVSCASSPTPEATAASSMQTLTGVVIRKPWTKTYESWNAGGSSYYVLKVEDGALDAAQRSAEAGVILRPSRSVPFARFAEFVGKRVRCRGSFVEGVARVPAEDVIEQAPMSMPNPITGKSDPPVRGSGFQVDAIALAQ